MFTGRHKRFHLSIAVRDAERISDQEVKEGKLPPVVWEGQFIEPAGLQPALEEALAWCKAEEDKAYEPGFPPDTRLKRGQSE